MSRRAETMPTLSSDIYRYIRDGRVQAAGINPAASVMTGAGVLFDDVVPGDIVPAYKLRIGAFTPAVLAAFAFDLWGERHRAARNPARGPTSATIGETA